MEFLTMSKVERLLNLTAVLLDTRHPISAKQLRSKIEGYPQDDDNFIRMFERDKDDLRSMGIPIEVETSFTDEVATEGYIISADDYYLPDLGLSEDELTALNLAALSVQIDGSDSSDAIWKLGGVSNSDDSLAQIDPEKTLANVSFENGVVRIFEAIKSDEVINFEYNDLERIVSPWRLDFRKGRWYLIGYDHEKSAERNFRLDRLGTEVSSCISKVSFMKPIEQSSSKKMPWEYGDDITKVKLWISKDRAESAKKTLGENTTITKNADGSLLCTLAVSNPEPFRSMVIDFLEHAEIIEPEEVRIDFISWLEKLGKSYG